MGVFDIFKKGFDVAEFEKNLTQLSEKINAIEQQIYKLKLASKRWTFNTVKYLSLVYLIANVYFYVNTPPNVTSMNEVKMYFRSLNHYQLLFVLFFPLVIVFWVRALKYVLGAIVNKQERSLKLLKKKHQSKIEELKKATNFNLTSELINRYGSESTLRQKASESQKATVDSKAAGPPTRNLNINVPDVPPIKPPSAGQSPVSGVSPKSAGSRTIQDRLLDILVGSDNNEAIESRFALICQNCYKHNGLALPGCTDPTKVKYICPYCGFPNGMDSTPTSAANDATGSEPSPTSAASKEEIPKASTVSSDSEDAVLKTATEAPVDTATIPSDPIEIDSGENETT